MNDGLRIGALVTPNRLADSDDVRAVIPALADAASVMGGYQIRNLATIGGNLASAVPSADLPPSLLVSGASVQLASEGNRRGGAVDAFITGPRQTMIRSGEIVVSVFVPAPAPRTGSAYEKFMLRDASALAVVGVAALVTLGEAGIETARIAVGAAAPEPFLATEAAWSLEGGPPDTERIEEAARLASEAAKPITDLRGSAEYRKELVRVLTKRAVARAIERAGAPEVVAC
jgi:carbon-monoxide dehydrogenase medium subunit